MNWKKSGLENHLTYYYVMRIDQYCNLFVFILFHLHRFNLHTMCMRVSRSLTLFLSLSLVAVIIRQMCDLFVLFFLISSFAFISSLLLYQEHINKHTSHPLSLLLFNCDVSKYSFCGRWFFSRGHTHDEMRWKLNIPFGIVKREFMLTFMVQ